LTTQEAQKTGRKTFEAKVFLPVREKAWERAAKQDRNPITVVHAILVKASKEAVPSEDGVAHPMHYPPGTKKKRIRFEMDEQEYLVIRDRIRASGKSMTAALTMGLIEYARTGKY
jgi:hypothetical protein